MCGSCYALLLYRRERRLYDRQEEVPLCDACALQVLVKPLTLEEDIYTAALDLAADLIRKDRAGQLQA